MIPVSLTLLSILCFGFLLGMRHAFDADHVVAVSTIVSRKRSIGAAALTAICWGAGHGLTMLGVGGAIVLSGLVVPQRVGLSLELGVALMLIVLGVVNVMRNCARGSRNAGVTRTVITGTAAPRGDWKCALMSPGSIKPCGRWRSASCTD